MLEPQITLARTILAAPSEEERAALRAGLCKRLPEIPARYFYDDVGSALFEKITLLDAYYPTRTEVGLLEAHAAALLAAVRPAQLVELGSGAGRKIRLILDAWPGVRGGTCTMLDINERFLRDSLARLAPDYPHTQLRGVVGDFLHDLDHLGPPAPRLFLFFAGTIGNLSAPARRDFLGRLAARLGPADALLLGVDRVKEPARLEAAYNDPEGITARFNLNMLRVLNQRFGGDFDPAAFRHRAFYDEAEARIEMRLVASTPQQVRLTALDLELRLAAGQEIRTEISCKFTRAAVEADAAAAGLALADWRTDPEDLFALALLRPDAPA